MGQTHFKAIAAVFMISLMASCKKGPCDCVFGPLPEGKKVFVVCEGSYGNGNSALTLYLPEKDSVLDDAYKLYNNKELGDVFQSITRIGARYFLCVNNSDKVVVLDGQLMATSFTTVPKPRYLLPVSGTKAYVSSIFTNKLFILDLDNISVKGSIDLPAMNTEGMLTDGDNVYVCPWDTACNQIYVIDLNTDRIVDSITVAGRAPSEVLMDKEHKLWVLSGNAAKGKQAWWTRIDPQTKQILKAYPFPEGADPIRPAFNVNRDSLYFIEVNYQLVTAHNGIYRMSIHDADLPETAFIPAQQGQYFWGLGLDPFDGSVYVGDPKGFVQKSTVTVYDQTGAVKKQFTAGVGAGHFYFGE